MIRWPRGLTAMMLMLASGAVVAIEPPPQPRPQKMVARAATGWRLAPFTLADQHGDPPGQVCSHDQLAGRWTLLLLADSRCDTTCQSALQALVALKQRIARADVARSTQVWMLALDPPADGGEHLRAAMAPYPADFKACTGTPQMLARVLDDLELGGRHVSGNLSGNVSGHMLLIGPDASVRAEYLPPFDPLALTAAYLKRRNGR